jgi:hypothetical protein
VAAWDGYASAEMLLRFADRATRSGQACRPDIRRTLLAVAAAGMITETPNGAT